MNENSRGRHRSRSNHSTRSFHTYQYHQDNNSDSRAYLNQPPLWSTMAHASNNRYSNLNDNVQEHEVIKTSDNKTNGKFAATLSKSAKESAKSIKTNNDIQKKEYVPPIKIQNKSISEVRHAIASIKNIKITPNMIRTTQHAIYVYANSISDFKVILRFFDDNNFKRVTHPLEEEMTVKFCLYGLEKMEYDILREELIGYNINPVKITNIPIKEARYADQFIYVLHFMKTDNVQLQTLQRIPGLFYTKIKFAIYDNPNKGQPVQCKRCQSFNHGDKNCTWDPKCRRCAGNHASKDCEHLDDLPLDPEDLPDYDDKGKEIPRPPKKDFTKKIDDKFLKCANCGGPHTASYRGCPARLEIIDLRQAMRERRANTQRKPSYNLADRNEFQRLPPPGPPRGNNSWRDNSSFYQQPSHQYQQNLSSHHSNQHQHSRNNINQFQHHDNQNDLFNSDELYMIMEDFMSKLSSCRSKFDQIRIIGQITFKYLASANQYD